CGSPKTKARHQPREWQPERPRRRAFIEKQRWDPVRPTRQCAPFVRHVMQKVVCDQHIKGARHNWRVETVTYHGPLDVRQIERLSQTDWVNVKPNNAALSRKHAAGKRAFADGDFYDAWLLGESRSERLLKKCQLERLRDSQIRPKRVLLGELLCEFSCALVHPRERLMPPPQRNTQPDDFHQCHRKLWNDEQGRCELAQRHS